MNTLLRRAALGMAFLVGFFLLGSTSAVAAPEIGGGSDGEVNVSVDVDRTVDRAVKKTRRTVTSASSDLSGEGNGGALSGNQAAAGNGSTSVDVGVCGNTVAVAGDASAECDGKQSSNKKNASSASNGRDTKRRILSANQAAALNNSSSVKVGVCGIAIAVAGEASGNCEGSQGSASATSLSSDGRNGNRAVLSDNQASALNGSPTGQVGVCGIALAVAGDATASCEGNQNSSHGSDTSLASTGARNRAIGSGNQAAVANGSPTGQVAVCGVAVGVAGDSSANCEGNQSSANESSASSGGSGDGNRDIVSGNQAAAGTGSPDGQAGVCGVAVALAGDSSATCEGNQASSATNDSSLSNGDSGRGDIGSRNQVAAGTGSPVAQVGVCGVAVGIAGDTSANCDGNRDSEADSSASSGGSGDADRGIGSGNQVAALTGSPTAQGGVCAVAVGVAGDSSATCEGNQSSANDSSQSNGAGGEGGIGSGNQAAALTGSPTAQAGVCAIVVTVAGPASADCVGSQSSNNPIDSGGGSGTGGDPGSGGGPGTGGGTDSGGGAGSGGGGAIGDDGSGGAGPGFVDVGSGPGFVALRPSVANGRYPLGGVQAGAGGTAREHVSGSPSQTVPGLIPAMLAIVLLTAGVTIRFAARRRHGEVAA